MQSDLVIKENELIDPADYPEDQRALVEDFNARILRLTGIITGIGKEYQKSEWMELIDLLLAEGLIRKTGDYNVLEVTADGKRFLASRSELRLPMRGDTNRGLKRTTRNSETTNLRGEKITAEKPAAGDQQAEAIMINLKAWRKRKADDMNVPPYVIFGDKTLLDLAAKKPKSRQELLNVYGIGRAKAEEFGRSILQIIEES